MKRPSFERGRASSSGRSNSTVSFDSDVDVENLTQVDLGHGGSEGFTKKLTLDDLVMPTNTPVSMKYPMYIMKCTTFLSLKENEYAPHQTLIQQGKVEHWEPRHRGVRIAFISHQVSQRDQHGRVGLCALFNDALLYSLLRNPRAFRSNLSICTPWSIAVPAVGWMVPPRSQMHPDERTAELHAEDCRRRDQSHRRRVENQIAHWVERGDQ